MCFQTFTMRGLWSALVPLSACGRSDFPQAAGLTYGRSQMKECLTYGWVRGPPGNGRSYRDPFHDFLWIR
jgi:hypothetical protein